MSSAWKVTWIAVVACFALLLGLERALRPNPRERNFEIFTEMAYSLAFESQSPDPLLPGGTTEQRLPDGVVVRGAERFAYGSGPEEAQRAGRELANPHAGDAAAAARGAEVYRIYCALCHGAGGAGDGPVVLRGMVPPPSMLAARAREMGDGEMFHILTLGQGNMASYAVQLDAADRWKAVLHVRALQEASR